MLFIRISHVSMWMCSYRNITFSLEDFHTVVWFLLLHHWQRLASENISHYLSILTVNNTLQSSGSTVSDQPSLLRGNERQLAAGWLDVSPAGFMTNLWWWWCFSDCSARAGSSWCWQSSPGVQHANIITRQEISALKYKEWHNIDREVISNHDNLV